MSDQRSVLERANKRHRAALADEAGEAFDSIDDMQHALAVHTGVDPHEFHRLANTIVNAGTMNVQHGVPLRVLLRRLSYAVFMLGWMAAQVSGEDLADEDLVQLPPIPRSLALDLVAGWTPPPGIAYDRWSDAVEHLQQVAAVACTPVTDEQWPAGRVSP